MSIFTKKIKENEYQMNENQCEEIFNKCQAKYKKIPLAFASFEKVMTANKHIKKIFFEDVYLAIAVCHNVENSWDYITNHYQKFIKLTISKCSWRKDLNDDIFQALMLEIPKKLCLYQGRCSLYGWLKVVTMNYTINWIKKNDDSQLVEIKKVDILETSFESIEIHQCQRYLEGILLEAVMDLAYQEQIMILCKFVDGLTNREIATKILMIKEPAFAKKLKQSMKKLKLKILSKSWKGGKVGKQTFENCIKLILEHTEYPIEFNNVLPSGMRRPCQLFIILFVYSDLKAWPCGPGHRQLAMP